jgi:hypothetical protein
MIVLTACRASPENVLTHLNDMWANLTYFLKAVIPLASIHAAYVFSASVERVQLRLVGHPSATFCAISIVSQTLSDHLN